jgi:very-short-patch-repair endonuclease
VRQAPVGPYYADFVCRACKLIVEVDGSQHADSAHDGKRDAILIALGYRVLRFWNADVLGSIEDVCETIVAAIEGRLTPFERFRQPMAEGGAAPHPALRATFPPQAGGRE